MKNFKYFTLSKEIFCNFLHNVHPLQLEISRLKNEIEIYRSSSDERVQLLAFLDFLRSVTREVEELLIVDDF